MKRSTLLWTIASIITLASLVYQRVTGPTYPMSGSAKLGATDIKYKLPRAHGGKTDCPIEILVSDTSIHAVLRWKRFKTQDPLTDIAMAHSNGVLRAQLPHQPTAGKLQYQLELVRGNERTFIPSEQPVIIRFRGDVPLWVVIPHVLAMFVAMLFSLRAGFEAFMPEPSFRKLVRWTIGVLFVGGFILGPTMQWFAFGKWWTGIPFGYDLTDNKTLVAFIGWMIAAAALRFAKNPKKWILAASVLMFVVYLIPHSVFGSEFDYSTIDRQSTQTK